MFKQSILGGVAEKKNSERVTSEISIEVYRTTSYSL